MRGTHFGIGPPERDENALYHDKLHDCTLVSAQGTEVKASTFVMVQACSVLASMFEDMTEEDGRVFHLPNVDHDTLSLLVSILHNQKTVGSISDVTEIRRVLLAMDYLGCRPKFKKLVTRLWQLLRLLPNTMETFGLLCENATLVMPEFSIAFLNKAKIICPEWHRFRVLFDDMDMTPQLAVLCMNTLLSTFPALLIVFGIVSASPPNHVHQILATVLSMPRIGLQFHPEEFMEVLESCAETVPPLKRNDPYTLLARACLDSYRGVNTPLCVSKISATFIFFQHKAKCSFLITLKKPITKKIKVQFQHGTATFDVDGEAGTVAANIQLHRFHENAESVDDAYVRTVPMYVREIGSHELDFEDMRDSWHTVENIDHANRGTLSHTVELPRDTFPLLKHLRYDVFWLHDPRIS